MVSQFRAGVPHPHGRIHGRRVRRAWDYGDRKVALLPVEYPMGIPQNFLELIFDEKTYFFL
jgi:hypothetical protein